MKTFFAVLLLTLCCAATADIYKWTDKNGVVHYEDQQPEKNNGATATKVDTAALEPIKPLAPTGAANTPQVDEGWLAQWINSATALKNDIQQRFNQWSNATPVVSNETILENQKNPVNKNPALPANTVEIYTTAWCGVCKKAKRWLTARGVAYKEFDVEKDPKALVRMHMLGGGTGVPFTVINGETFQGFDANAYQAALRK